MSLPDGGLATTRSTRAKKSGARSSLPAAVDLAMVPGPLSKGSASPASPRTSSASDDHRAKLLQETPTPTPSTVSFVYETEDEMEQPPRSESSQSFVTTDTSQISQKKLIEQFFSSDVREAAKTAIPFEDIGWCNVAETRLFKRLMMHKPAGVFRDLEYTALVSDMNRIVENDPLTDYRNELTPEDYETYLKRIENGEAKDRPCSYEPAYKVRPNATAIKNKLGEYFNLNKVHQMELTANPVQSVMGEPQEFQLPADLLKLKDSGRNTS